jgi:hypothetical protein
MRSPSRFPFVSIWERTSIENFIVALRIGTSLELAVAVMGRIALIAKFAPYTSSPEFPNSSLSLRESLYLPLSRIKRRST